MTPPPTRTEQPRRKSIQPTYDHRETGDRFTVETRVNGRRLAQIKVRDPFTNTRVVVGWRDLLRWIIRGREISVHVDGDHGIVEDVIELDADYTGARYSSRRAEWDAELQGKLQDFAARLGEHDVS